MTGSDGSARPGLERTIRPRRVLGRITSRRPGPTLIAIAGLHGNEPAGVDALQRLLPSLQEQDTLIRGEFLALTGNLTALQDRVRYVDEDLNRIWTADQIAQLQQANSGTTESGEQVELWEALESTFSRVRGPCYILDLHTTSGHGPPFVTIEDTLANRAMGLQYPVPLVLGLEEYLDGTLLSYLNARGYVTIGVEAGQHNDPAAIDYAEAATWIALAATAVFPADRPEVRRAHARLSQAGRSLPRVFEVRYRHPVGPDDEFCMESGFDNFQQIRLGQRLARENGREIRARENGRVLLPLYQELGDDGFFIVREFRPIWLRISTALRRLRLDACLHWLPGVSKHPSRPDTLIVDRKIARWQALRIFHLLGYRRERSSGDKLLVSRRKQDTASGPDRR